jgi:lanosterol synthase
VKYIKSTQRKDGSWKGSWGVCFTYAIWFGIEGLVAVGETYQNSSEVRKACEFLVGKQNEDGGWGEDFQSCVQMNWVNNPDGSQVVNTAWAVLSLLLADYPNADVIYDGIRVWLFTFLNEFWCNFC